MRNLKTYCALAVFVCCVSQSTVATGDTPDDGLEARISQLERELSELRGELGDGWLTDARATHIRAIVQEVLADADARASLLQGGGGAGYNGGFFITDPEQAFSLKVNGYIQSRFALSLQDDDAPVDGDEKRYGFEVRRAYLYFSGHVFSSDWMYKVQGNFSSSSGDFELNDGFIARRLDDRWKLQFGQYKMPFTRETLISDTKGLAVERSLVDGLFSNGRSQGVMIDYQTDRYHASAMLSDGRRATNTAALAMDTEYAVTARTEMLVAGESLKQFGDRMSWRDDEFAALVGGAAHYERGEFGTSSEELDYFAWTVDGSVEFGGAVINAAIVGRHIDSDSSPKVDQYGAVIEGGLFLTDHWDVFGRLEWGDDDTDADELLVATVGVNRYFSRTNLRWTTDLGYGLNAVGDTWDSSGAAWRRDVGDEDGQVVVRSQLQLEF